MLSSWFGSEKKLKKLYDRISGECYDVASNPLLNSSGAKLVGIVSAIAVVVAGGAIFAATNLNFGSKPTTAESPGQEVKKEEAAAAIGALGRLEPAGEIFKIAPPAGGFSSRILQLKVKEGDKVKSGQPIAIMDSYPSLLASAQQAEAQVLLAQSQLEGVKAGAKSGDLGAQQSTIATEQAQGRQAEGEVARAGADLQSAGLELEKVKAAGIRLKAELKNAEWDFEKYSELYKKGAVSESEWRKRELTFVSKKQEVEQGEKTIAQAERLVQQRGASLAQAQAGVQKAVARVTAENQRLGSVAEVRPTDVKQAEANLMVAQANFEKAKIELDKAVVKSPIPATVLKVYSKDNEAVGTSGIMDLGITEQMYVVAEVDENSISKVSVGNRAIIKSDAFQGDISGKVERVGAQVRKNAVTSSDPSDKQDIRVVEVKIRLDDSKPVQALTNLQVKVSIQP
jgi:HlyD family secretion protein